MNIYESIAAVQADVPFIGKDKKAEKQDYKYRGVDQVYNSLHPLFAQHKVFAVPEVLEITVREIRETKSGGVMTYQVLKVKYRFYAEDGTFIDAIVLGEAMDSGDKVSNKCMSVAYKYACFQILSIPTEETSADPDDSQEEFASRGQKGKKTENEAPMSASGASKRNDIDLPQTLDEWSKCRITATNLMYFGVPAKEAATEMKLLTDAVGKAIADFDRADTAKAWGILWKCREAGKYGKG